MKPLFKLSAVKLIAACVAASVGAKMALAEDMVMPPLPFGSSENALPASLAVVDVEDDFTLSPWEFNGFVETRAGARLQSDPYQGEGTLAETRLQLELDYSGEGFTSRIRSDLLVDLESDDETVSLNQGSGLVDLREAWLQKGISGWLDLKLGRQILTWGVGDQLFINDLFPKDWKSFFLGRDLEYLKAPSDALKLAFYFEAFSLDLIWIPEFDADRYIDGKSISFYNPLLGRRSGSDLPVRVTAPDGDEFSVRLYKNISGVEYALYAYDGYWKSPNGFDPLTTTSIHSRLRVAGASLRKSFVGGVLSGEVGRYNSSDDSGGDNPFIANSETRLLLGFERELASNFTGSFQYYVERLEDYSAYKESVMASQIIRDKYRQLLTARLTLMTMNQNLEWSLFTFYSPTDQDWFLQPKVSYKYSDRLLLTAGLNVFEGQEVNTFFAQFSDNSNVYAGVRYSF